MSRSPRSITPEAITTSSHSNDENDSSNPESLCPACQRIFERAAFPPFYSTNDEHHHTFADFEAAVEQGCFICFALWETITDNGENLTLRVARNTCFTRYAVSNQQNRAPFDVERIELKGGRVWRPGEGLMSEELLDPSKPWLVSIAFHHLGRAKNLNFSQVTSEYELHFSLEPVEKPATHPLHNINTETTHCDQNWDLVSRWLGECLNDHPQCREGLSSRQSRFCPTRLLDVGSAQACVIKLIETQSTTLDGQYIALSHCWGTSPMPVLTQSATSVNDRHIPIPIQNLIAGIDYETLPSTFQDTVILCRRLEIRYLWIDSLCILQDSVEDWRIESSKMHLVYGNAFLTVAATGSTDGTGGLFQPRFPSTVSPVIVAPTWAATRKFLLVPQKIWQNGVSEAPLNRRAWVLQERVLSPRVIHFGQSQIFWECKTHDCCETFPHGLPEAAQDLHTRFKGIDLQVDGEKLCCINDRSKTRPKNQASQALKKKESVPDMSSTDDSNQLPIEREIGLGQEVREQVLDSEENKKLNGYYVWSRLLEKYCRSRLTKESDKLIALSGLAQHFEAELKDRYIVGLWESIFPSQLLWKAGERSPGITFDANNEPDNALTERNTYPCATRPESRRAPSWSWASVEGSIATANPDNTSALFDYQVISLGGSEDTSINDEQSAALIVDGDLHIAYLFYEQGLNNWMMAINKRAKRVAPSDRRLKGTSAVPKFLPDHKDQWNVNSWGSFIRAIAYPDTKLEADSILVFCLPLLRRHRTRALQAEDTITENPKVSGLMLMPCGAGAYRRIGIFDTIESDPVDGQMLGFGEEYCYQSENQVLFGPDERLLLV